LSEPVTSAAGGTGDRESGLTARWVTFGYLFTLYFILGGAETMISPLFPLVREDLDLSESNLAAILAAVAGGIAAFNVIGGAVSRWLSDRSLVRNIRDRVAVMYLGRIVEITTADQLYNSPRHPYTISLLSAVPIPDPIVDRTRTRIVLEGDVPSPVNPPSGCTFHTRCPHAKDICRVEVPLMREVADGHMASCHLVDEI